MTEKNDPTNISPPWHSSPSGSSSSSSSSSNQLSIPSRLSSSLAQPQRETLIDRPLQALHMSRSERFASFRPFFYGSFVLLPLLGERSVFSSSESSSLAMKYGSAACLFLGCGLGCAAYFTRTSEENWQLQAREKMSELAAQGDHELIKKELKEFIIDSVGCNGRFEGNISRAIKLLDQICEEEMQRAQENKAPAPLSSNYLRGILQEKERPLFTTLELKRGKTIQEPARLVCALVDEKMSGNREIEAPDLSLDDLKEERKWRLEHKEEIYQRVTQDPLHQTAVKFFPFTRAWYAGSFECVLAEIGREHGITVISSSNQPEFLEKDNTLRLIQKEQRAFPQDFLDFNPQEVCFPATVDSNDPIFRIDILKEAMEKARIKRFPPYANLHEIDPIWAITRGDPYRFRSYRISLDLANALGAQAAMSLTYSEGGNMLLGVADGEAFAIIGLDSFSASKALMENHMKRKVDDSEVETAFGVDYGIRRERLFFIEQPGDFHLDMNMAIVGPNTIVINDSIMAYNVLAEKIGSGNLNKLLTPLEELSDTPENILKTTRERSETKKIFEDESARQLEKKGFKVIRVAGRFELYLPRAIDPIPLMNFFNMVTAEAPNGKRLVIAMGCPDKNVGFDFEQLFTEMLDKGELHSGTEVYFLDYRASRDSLTKNGGVSCAVKTLAFLPKAQEIEQ